MINNELENLFIGSWMAISLMLALNKTWSLAKVVLHQQYFCQKISVKEIPIDWRINEDSWSQSYKTFLEQISSLFIKLDRFIAVQNSIQMHNNGLDYEENVCQLSTKNTILLTSNVQKMDKVS